MATDNSIPYSQNWQDIDTSTIAGLYAIDHEIDLRLYGESIPHIKHYSTDLNHTFELLDPLDGLRFDTAWNHDTGEVTFYGVTIYEGALHAGYKGKGKTRALALCVAWLTTWDAHHPQQAHDANGRGAV